MENVRLLIWDLDETFWSGTITEGGIFYNNTNHNIVIELARRGIISSICSKNDAAVIFPILEKHGIRDYFVFPSVSWEPKSSRIAKIIEAAQLRAPTVMFLDDNHGNRAEAASMIAGLQVEDENFISQLLSDARFKGKSDREMKRLEQYRLLERKQDDQISAGGSNEEFLRTSDIRVYIDYDVESNIDRAIELINRTNQLNFTKNRIPEDLTEARAYLRIGLNSFANQAGLIRVADKYGDYGYVGFFQASLGRKNYVEGLSQSKLVHFCFSCRTMGMLIEQWVYEYLRRPELEVVGDVLTDLSAPKNIDWIRLVRSNREISSGDAYANYEKIANNLFLQGGCEANAIGVYLRAYANDMHVFGNFQVGQFFCRVNFASAALDVVAGNSRGFDEEAKILGIPTESIASDFVKNCGYGSVFVSNCMLDASRSRPYRHKTKDWWLWLEPSSLAGSNLVLEPEETIRERLRSSHDEMETERILELVTYLKDNYDAPDRTEKEKLDSVRALINAIPPGSKFIFALDHHLIRYHNNEVIVCQDTLRFKEQIRKLAEEYDYVGVVEFSDVIYDENEVLIGGNHYDRMVYLRFAERVAQVAKSLPEKSGLSPSYSAMG